MNKNSEPKPDKLIILQGVKSKYPLSIPARKTYKARDILRIQSQLIAGFIKGEIEGEPAKTLSYLCNTYLNSLQSTEFETRLEKLERKNKNEH